MLLAVIQRLPGGPSRTVVDMLIDGSAIISQGIVLAPWQALKVIALPRAVEVAIERHSPPIAPILSAAPSTAPVRVDANGAVVISDVSRDSVRALLYDLGLRGLTDKQRATVEAWLGTLAR